MRIVFVNRFFHTGRAPTGRLAADAAFHLAAQGLEVHAVTSRQRYYEIDALPSRFERVDGVSIHRIRSTHFVRAGLIGRALDYLSFHVGAMAMLLRLLRHGDIVVAKTDPPLLSACGALAARLKGARLVNWQQDVFPEIAAELGFRVVGGPVGAALRALRDWSLRSAVANVVLGEGMAERLGRLTGTGTRRLTVIHNWMDGSRVRPLAPSASRLREQWGMNGHFVVGYSGNMGRAHEFDTILAACERLKTERDIAFLFIGSGVRRASVESFVRERALENVTLLPYVDEAKLSESLGACDVHLVSLFPALEGLIVPSKFYGVAAAGRPTVYVGDPDGEIPRILAKHSIGITVRTGDTAGLLQALRALRDNEGQRLAMGARARTVFEHEWDKPIALEKWSALIASVAAQGEPSA
jgi:glycosyltransferase involved in cell wall biosynthesis